MLENPNLSGSKLAARHAPLIPACEKIVKSGRELCVRLMHLARMTRALTVSPRKVFARRRFIRELWLSI
jgi:hypothetical protein